MEVGKRVKPKKKTGKRALAAQCDKLFSQVVRLGGYCFNCGSNEFIQCAHGISRRYRAVRWDQRNAWPLCRKCHVFFTHRPLEWDEWLLKEWGTERYMEMRNLALSGERPDLEAIAADLKERLAQAA